MAKLQLLVLRALVLACSLVGSMYLVSRLLTALSAAPPPSRIMHAINEVSEAPAHQMLFFNRVPKTGSELLVLLLTWLQARNSFSHVRLQNSVNRHLDQHQQELMADEIMQHLKKAKTRSLSFDRHVHFTNLSSVSVNAITYINILRDPIEKLTSRFYYARATPRPGGFTPPKTLHEAPREVPPYSSFEDCMTAGHDQCTYIAGREYDLSIPYFCGHEAYCRELGNSAALATAKRHLTHLYPVVGVLEELNATLTVLQATLPQYFRGVYDLYHKELGAPHWNANFKRPPGISADADSVLRRNLSLEVNFYNFARDRLLQQYNRLNS